MKSHYGRLATLRVSGVQVCGCFEILYLKFCHAPFFHLLRPSGFFATLHNVITHLQQLARVS